MSTDEMGAPPVAMVTLACDQESTRARIGVTQNSTMISRLCTHTLFSLSYYKKGCIGLLTGMLLHKVRYILSCRLLQCAIGTAIMEREPAGAIGDGLRHRFTFRLQWPRQTSSRGPVHAC